MQFAVSVYKNSDIESLISVGDSFVVYVPNMSCVYDPELRLDDALEKLGDREVILGINKVYLEDELDNLRSFMNTHSKYKFLVSDLGAVQIAKELGLIDRVIYDPNTLICNSMELGLFSNYGFDAIGMSSEIPLSDIKSSFIRTGASLIYQVFGRKIMFYSKRRLVDIYKEFSGLDFGHEGIELQEFMRTQKYPMFYNEGGTYVYRDYLISLLEEMNNLSFLKYAYFEGITLSAEVLANVVNIFKIAINSRDLESAKQELINLNLNIQDGFAYKDTAYVKEGFDE
ncbi:MAG: U32 family peptidase [Bacilli bacterium]|nr:U32 family peptidase [Bacilli bacterium]